MIPLGRANKNSGNIRESCWKSKGSKKIWSGGDKIRNNKMKQQNERQIDQIDT